jgi:diacylglycerol kinase (ATP)
MRVGVVAHRGKTFGGGLVELRAALADAGVTDLIWYEIGKSRDARRRTRKCVEQGAELVIAWGGDGTVQACLGALVDGDAGRDVALAIAPAGTANLLASNLGVPRDVRQAVDVALHGARRPLDVGVMNDEAFAVMAGVGFDARMIRDADRGLKDRVGRAAYVWTGLKNLRNRSTRARIRVDGRTWFDGRASCVLVGNVGSVLGGVTVFPDAAADDGLLEIGVVEADSWWQWVRVLARTAVGDPGHSPLVSLSRGAAIDIRLRHKLPYQLDGGARKAKRRLEVRARRHAITVCVPATGGG